MAVAYLKTGDVFYDAADLQTALSYHQQASEVLEPLAKDNLDVTSNREIALFLNRIAIDKRGLGDINGAVESDLKAIAVQKEISGLDPRNEQSRLDLANYQQSLAESYARLGKRDEAYRPRCRIVGSGRRRSSSDGKTKKARAFKPGAVSCLQNSAY